MGVVRASPLHHVDALDGEDLFQAVDRARLLDHDSHHDVAQRLHVLRAAAVAHVREAARGDAIRAAIVGGFRTHDPYALAHVRGRTAVGEQDAVEPDPTARWARKPRGSWSTLSIIDMS
jgi:hypothetical protein